MNEKKTPHAVRRFHYRKLIAINFLLLASACVAAAQTPNGESKPADTTAHLMPSSPWDKHAPATAAPTTTAPATNPYALPSGWENLVKAMEDLLHASETRNKRPPDGNPADPAIPRPRGGLPPVAQEFPWVPVDTDYGKLFPSIELADDVRTKGKSVTELGPPFLGEFPNSPYAVEVTAPAGVSVRVEVSCDELMEPSAVEVKIENAGDYAIVPRVKWKLRALRACNQTHAVEMHWNLWVNGQPLEGRRVTVLAQPVNILPVEYDFTDPTVKPLSCAHYFAAFANENHPLIEPILKEALETHVVSSFSGLKTNDPQEVRNQVLAIWWALQKRGIVYSSIVNPATPDDEHQQVQRVRFFEDVIEARAANCVDGTLVFASLLRHIGLAPVICLVEGHAFLGYYVSGEKKEENLVYLETTLLNERSAYLAAIKNYNGQTDARGAKKHAALDPGPATLTCPREPELALEMFRVAEESAKQTMIEAAALEKAGKDHVYKVDLEVQRKFYPPIPPLKND